MKFLADAMLGKLTRLLRIFGYDVVYANDLENYFNISPIPDEKLKDFAEKDGRIILTKDYTFYKRNKNKSIFLEGNGVYNYLNQLKTKLDLKYNFLIEKARCSLCNSTLIKVKNKKDIEDKVKASTFKYHNNFYQCSNQECRKIFWRGSHIDDIIKRLKKNIG
ncbi:MAG: DUF5615 family PIN-like protein [Promethearchaeota archaeon]